MLEESAPDSHKYKYCDQQPTDRKAFFGAVQKEVRMIIATTPREYIKYGSHFTDMFCMNGVSEILLNIGV